MDQQHKQYKSFWGRMKKRPACGVKKKFLKTLILHVHCTHIISCTIFIFKSPLCNRVGVEKKTYRLQLYCNFFSIFWLKVSPQNDLYCLCCCWVLIHEKRRSGFFCYSLWECIHSMVKTCSLFTSQKILNILVLLSCIFLKILTSRRWWGHKLYPAVCFQINRIFAEFDKNIWRVKYSNF